MACNYLNFRQLEKINTQRQQNEIFMTFLLCKATKRPVDKRRNQNVKPHKKLGLKNKKKRKPTTEQKKFMWHVLAPCFRYTFNAILTHANDRTQPN